MINLAIQERGIQLDTLYTLVTKVITGIQILVFKLLNNMQFLQKHVKSCLENIMNWASYNPKPCSDLRKELFECQIKYLETIWVYLDGATGVPHFWRFRIYHEFGSFEPRT